MMIIYFVLMMKFHGYDRPIIVFKTEKSCIEMLNTVEDAYCIKVYGDKQE